MREGHKDQHLVAGFFNNLKHDIQAVADIELQNLPSIRIDRASANLQELVDLCCCVDRTDLFARCLYQHLVLDLGVVLRLLRGKRRFALNEGNLR